jgi:hypothetical protein
MWYVVLAILIPLAFLLCGFALAGLAVKSARVQAYCQCMIDWCEYGQTLNDAGQDVILTGIEVVQDRAIKRGDFTPED